MTIDEFVGQGWIRWIHLHEELSFDKITQMLEEVSYALEKRKDKWTKETQQD